MPNKKEGLFSMSEGEGGIKDRERLSGLERDVAHLDERITYVMSEMRQGFDGIRKAVEYQKTPVAQMAGWATVAITLIAAILWPQIKSDERHDKFNNNMRDSFIEHVRDGHPGRVEERVTNNSMHIDKLDLNLQREMRDRDEIIATGLTNLDTNLQREMRMLADSRDERLRGLEKNVDRVLHWITDHDKKVPALNAKQSAKIESLEKRLKP